MSWNLANRVAIVTGGTGVIGRVVATRLISAGAHVFVTSRTAAGCDKLKSDLSGIAGAVVCDMATEKSCEESIKEIAASSKSSKRIDLFVHCAGATLNKLVARTTEEDLYFMFQTNALAPILLAKSAVRHGGMLARKDGACITIGSVVGEDGNAGQTAYAASKGAVSAAWKSMGKEFGGKGVRFNVVAPGLVESEMAMAMGKEHRERWLVEHGRMVTAEEVADAVIACCDPEMNGRIVRIDGQGMR